MNDENSQQYALAMVGHDLNTHLSTLQGFLDLLEDTPLDSRQAECLSTAAECAQDLRRSLDRLVESARTEFETAGRGVEERDVTSELDTTVSRFKPLAMAKGLRLTFHAEHKGASAKVDWEKLQRVVVNLVSNSIKFTDYGGVRVEVAPIESESRDSARAFRLDVIDSGIGMAVDQIDIAFQPFRQLAPSGYRDGVGLGLAIVRRLVRELGGEIAVSSQLNYGTTITVIVPVAD